LRRSIIKRSSSIRSTGSSRSCGSTRWKAAKSSKIKNIEDFGYGKGYIAAVDYWRVILKKLEVCRAKGMNVILIAHSARKMTKDPARDDYEKKAIKLHEKAAALVEEWADVIGYCEWDISTAGDADKGERVKAFGTGRRIIHVDPENPAFLTKTRYQLPKKLAMPKDQPWEAFAAAIRGNDGAAIIALTQRLEERIRELGDADVELVVRNFVKDNGATASALEEAIRRTNETITERRQAS
jgi:hypothetical protein